jgi:hypothetical protein
MTFKHFDGLSDSTINRYQDHVVLAYRLPLADRSYPYGCYGQQNQRPGVVLSITAFMPIFAEYSTALGGLVP